jgi:hypothetical protein
MFMLESTVLMREFQLAGNVRDVSDAAVCYSIAKLQCRKIPF